MGDNQTSSIDNVYYSNNRNSPTCTTAIYYYKHSPSVSEQVQNLQAAFPYLNFDSAEERAEEFRISGKADCAQIVILPKISALANARRREIRKERITFWGPFEYLSTFFPYNFGYCWLASRVIYSLPWEKRICPHPNWSGRVKTNMIQIHEDVKFVLKDLELKDDFDYLILAINFSRSNSIINNSPSLARQEALKNSKHLVLGFVQTGCLLIGDPDRLISSDKYKLECPADRYMNDQEFGRIWGLYYILDDIGGINTLSYDARDSAYAEPWSCIPIATLE